MTAARSTHLTWDQVNEWRRMCEDMPDWMPVEEIVRINAGDFHELCLLAMGTFEADSNPKET